MKNIKAAGLLLIVALALSAVAASAASASEFIYSKGGSIKGKAVSNQRFELGNAGVACSKATVSGLVTLKFHELPLSVNYGECEIEGAGPATVTTTANYTWLLPPGVQFDNAVTIHTSTPGLYCTVVIDSGQSLGGKTGEVEYENKSGKIIVKNHVNSIAYEVTESSYAPFCGHVGEKNTNGTFRAEDELELEGGTMEVK